MYKQIFSAEAVLQAIDDEAENVMLGSDDDLGFSDIEDNE